MTQVDSLDIGGLVRDLDFKRDKSAVLNIEVSEQESGRLLLLVHDIDSGKGYDAKGDQKEYAKLILKCEKGELLAQLQSDLEDLGSVGYNVRLI